MPVLQCFELIGERITFGNRTLRYTVHTVHLHRIQLTDAMPVNRCAVGVVVVLDVDHKLIAPACLDQGAGECIVEHFATGLLEAIRFELWGKQKRLLLLRFRMLGRLGGGGITGLSHTVISPLTSSQYCILCQQQQHSHSHVSSLLGSLKVYLTSDALGSGLHVLIYSIISTPPIQSGNPPLYCP